jgi:hypothetical protein
MDGQGKTKKVEKIWILYELLSGWKNVQQFLSEWAGQNRDQDQNMDLLQLAKFLILHRNWFVNERFEVAIELHHTDDFDDCIGEVELSKEISIDDGKDGASKACEILGRMSKDIDAQYSCDNIKYYFRKRGH